MQAVQSSRGMGTHIPSTSPVTFVECPTEGVDVDNIVVPVPAKINMSGGQTSQSTQSTHGLIHAGEDEDKRERSVSAVLPTLPISQSAALAIIDMLGSITFLLLIRYSKALEKAGLMSYDNASAVFWIEMCKLTFSVCAMYFRTGKFLPTSVIKEGTWWRVGIYFAVPSFIYAVYNNLTFFNLSIFDPGTFQVFMQTRVLFAGALFTFVIRKRRLSRRRWFALALLSFGVAGKHITPGRITIDARIAFLLFQASLSAFAGVYNEYLLKKDITMDVNEQNFFMYSFALVFNLMIGFYGNPTYYTSGALFSNWSLVLFLIVINGAVVGIVTSLILKFFNVTIKNVASACQVLLTLVLAAVFLGESFTLQDFIACCIVVVSIYVYYLNVLL